MVIHIFGRIENTRSKDSSKEVGFMDSSFYIR